MTFDIDANGMLNVSAKDKGTGKEQSITITASSGLSKEEVEGMVEEAELNADEDRKKREEVELRNNVENAVFSAEKLLQDNEDKISGELKTEVEDKVSALKAMMEGQDKEQIDAALQDLQSAMQKVGEVVYAQPDQPGTANENTENDEGNGDDKDDKTVEGEYREV